MKTRTRKSLIDELRTTHPFVCVEVTASPDQHYVWGEDLLNPLNDWLTPHIVQVRAFTIIMGDAIEGVDCLGGCFAENAESFNEESEDEGSDYNIHGYFPGMLKEAVSLLEEAITEKQKL